MASVAFKTFPSPEALALAELDPTKEYVIFANPQCVDIVALANTDLSPTFSALNGAQIIAIKPLRGQSLADAIAIHERV